MLSIDRISAFVDSVSRMRDAQKDLRKKTWSNDARKACEDREAEVDRLIISMKRGVSEEVREMNRELF